MTKRLIVNADDYGHTPGTCLGIRRAHLQCIVTSTSAMMNRPLAPAELTVAARTCPDLGVGVHLVLTTGKPVLSPDRITTIVDNDGKFLKLESFCSRLGTMDIDQVWAEWNAQVEKFIYHYGKAPDHLDSHHHSSYYTPALFERMCRLAEQVHCAIRKPFGPDAADAADYLPPQLVEKAIANYSAYTSHPTPVTTDRFIGTFYDTGATREHLLAILGEIAADAEHETFELMCHPSAPDHELGLLSDYNDKRMEELAILQDQEVLRHLEEMDIKLITYSKL
jgi:chitin disaccharide deacetylase